MNIELIGLDRSDWEQVAQAPEAFADHRSLALGVAVDVIRGVAEQNLALFARNGVTSPPWSGFVAVDRVSQTIVGVCGFTSSPDAEGLVEIAYFTFPSFEGRGVATRMAADLIEAAAAAGGVRRIIAHTLPEKNASGRVLEKSGFMRIGEVVHPEDGTVWRWERP
jgi:ribosomal-protein-alanine N-acetyltransferase